MLGLALQETRGRANGSLRLAVSSAAKGATPSQSARALPYPFALRLGASQQSRRRSLLNVALARCVSRRWRCPRSALGGSAPCAVAAAISIHYCQHWQATRGERGLTIHSSRSRFAARLNSGVRPRTARDKRPCQTARSCLQFRTPPGARHLRSRLGLCPALSHFALVRRSNPVVGRCPTWLLRAAFQGAGVAHALPLVAQPLAQSQRQSQSVIVSIGRPRGESEA